MKVLEIDFGIKRRWWGRAHTHLCANKSCRKQIRWEPAHCFECRKSTITGNPHLNNPSKDFEKILGKAINE